MTKSVEALRFLFVGPLILAFLFVVNLMTSPGHWWVQWRPWASASRGSSA